VQVGLENQSSAKYKAKLWFRLDGMLCGFSKSSQQHIFTQQRPGLDGTPIHHLHKAVSVGYNFISSWIFLVSPCFWWSGFRLDNFHRYPPWLDSEKN
jgi:hypothetical protein